MSGNTWLRVGAASGGLVVILGSFLAHGLRVPEEKLDEMGTVERRAAVHRMEVFETGAQYQMSHSLAIVAVGLASIASGSSRNALLNAAGWGFLIGIVLFSGSLYLIGLGGPRWLGMIAPLGGLSFIAAWFLLTAAAGKVAIPASREVFHRSPAKETSLMP